MPQHLHTTPQGKHVYSYSEEEVAAAVSLAFQWAITPSSLEKLSALRDRDGIMSFARRVARTLDDAADCSELWDTGDIDYAFTQEVQ